MALYNVASPCFVTLPMVRDGYFYAAPLIAAAASAGLADRPAWAIIPLLLAFFFLWFFRDPGAGDSAGCWCGGLARATAKSPMLLPSRSRNEKLTCD